MPDENTEQPMREIPLNELDFSNQLANPVWGDKLSKPDLRKKLNIVKLKTDENGQPLFQVQKIIDGEGKPKEVYMPIIEELSEYDNLSFLTRDFRLSNLNDEQVTICQYWTELAADLLQDGFKKAHIAALSRVAIILEVNQSRKGFLRKNMNTLRQESTHQEVEPAKKSFFGGGKKNGGM